MFLLLFREFLLFHVFNLFRIQPILRLRRLSMCTYEVILVILQTQTKRILLVPCGKHAEQAAVFPPCPSPPRTSRVPAVVLDRQIISHFLLIKNTPDKKPVVIGQKPRSMILGNFFLSFCGDVWSSARTTPVFEAFFGHTGPVRMNPCRDDEFIGETTDFAAPPRGLPAATGDWMPALASTFDSESNTSVMRL